MIRSVIDAVGRPTRNERGVALPLALLGLVAISLMVTTALVTSSTELAISSAYSDATRALYVAEGGLQAYIGARGPDLMADTGSAFVYQPPSGASEEAVQVGVAFLGEHRRTDQSTLRVFSVEAFPQQGGGRRVAMLVKQIIPPPIPLRTNVRSAITLGGDLDVNGNAFTVSGRSTACGSSGVQAINHASTSEITVNNVNHWDNFVGVDSLGGETRGTAAVQNSGIDKQQLAREALGLPEGLTLEDLIDRIPSTHKWGPRFSPPGGTVRSFDGTVDPYEYVAVVDANGGTVDLRGGAGVLIVVNGDLEMQGSATFDGIVVVERNFRLSGTPNLTGALISLGDSGRNEIVLDPSAIGNGAITVQYEKCKITEAEDAFARVALGTLPATISSDFAWLEVVR